MTDTVYKVSVDATAANAELDRLHKSATSAAGAEDKLQTSTAAVSREFSTAAVSINKYTHRVEAAEAATIAKANATEQAKKATDGWRGTLNKMPDILGKQAAAISLVSSSLGEQGGQIGKVVAGAGQMAAAFGAGGPFAAALVGGIFLVGQLSSHLDGLNKKQDEAIEKLYGPMEAAIETRKKVERDIAQLRRDAAGPETSKQAFERVQSEIDGVEAQIRALTATRNAMKIGTAGYDEARASLQGQIGQLTKTIELLQTKQNLEQGKAATAGLSSAPSTPKTKDTKTDWWAMGDDEVKAFADSQEAISADIANQVDYVQSLKDAAQDRERARFEELEALAQRRADNEEMFAQMSYAQAKESARLEQEIMKERSAYITDAAVTTSRILVKGAIDAASGQEDAAATMLGALAEQAGGYITLEGGKLLATGIASTLLGNPAGVVQAAAGLGLVAAGQAISIGGPSVVSQLVGGGAGSSGGAARGAPRGPSGGAPSSGGGGTNITIVYSGAAGPSADQGARAVIDAQTRAASRDLGRSPDR
jgi:hypothetical protein